MGNILMMKRFFSGKGHNRRQPLSQLNSVASTNLSSSSSSSHQGGKKQKTLCSFNGALSHNTKIVSEKYDYFLRFSSAVTLFCFCTLNLAQLGHNNHVIECYVAILKGLDKEKNVSSEQNISLL